MSFQIKEKLILWIYGSKSRSFSTHEVGRKMISPQYLGNLHDISRNEKNDISVLKKKQKNKKQKKNDKM